MILLVKLKLNSFAIKYHNRKDEKMVFLSPSVKRIIFFGMTIVIILEMGIIRNRCNANQTGNWQRPAKIIREVNKIGNNRMEAETMVNMSRAEMIKAFGNVMENNQDHQKSVKGITLRKKRVSVSNKKWKRSLLVKLVREFSITWKYIRRVNFLHCDKMNAKRSIQDETIETYYNNRSSIDHPSARDRRFLDKCSSWFQRKERFSNADMVKSLLEEVGSDILIKTLAIETLVMNGRMEDVLKSDDHRQIIVLDISCGNTSLQILELASKLGLFNSSYHWLLIEEYYIQDERKDYFGSDGFGSNGTAQENWSGRHPRSDWAGREGGMLIEFLAKLNINMNTELILARNIDPDQRDYLLFDIWNPGWQFGGKLNVTKVGRFSERNGLQMYDWFKRTTSIVRRMDMKNVPIRCMIVITNKLHENFVNYLEHLHDAHLDSMHRFNFAMLSYVRDMFNFTFHIYRTDSWGYVRNGTVNGMIGALVRREVDIGGSPAFFHLERAQLIDYTAHTWIARPCFIFRNLHWSNSSWNVFLQPFSNIVWILIVCCGFVKIFLLWKLRKIENQLIRAKGVYPFGIATKIKGRCTYQKAQNMKCSQQSRLQHYHGKEKKKTFQIQSKTENSTNKSHRILKELLTGFFVRCFSHYTSKETNHPHENRATKSLKSAEQQKMNYIKSHKEDASGTFGKIRFHLNANKRWKHNGLQYLRSTANDNSILDSVVFFIGALCQQGSVFVPYFISGKCIVLTTFLFAFCIHQFYLASIESTLLMEKPKMIRTLRDLIESSLEVGIEDIPYNRDYFQRTTDPDAIELYRWKVNSVKQDGIQKEGTPGTTIDSGVGSISSPVHLCNSCGNGKNKVVAATTTSTFGPRRSSQSVRSNWHSPEEGLKLMKAGGYAFHVDVATAYKIIRETFTEREICELTEIQLFPPQKTVGVVQKGSPLRKMITYGLRRTMESGLMDRQRKVWHSQKPRCVRQIHPDDLQVGMQTFSSALFILIYGSVASLSILALEILHNLWQKKSTNRGNYK